MPDISKKTFIWAIIGLIVLRIILMILVMNNIPDTGMRDGGFRPTFTESYQPDEFQFFELSKNLAKGQTIKLVPNIGAPLVFAPLIYFSGVDSLDKLAPIVFIFQTFILFSLAIILVAFIGYYLFNSRTLALASASLFVIYPWLLLGIFKFIGYDNAIAAFHYQLWIFTLSDYLSAFWVYLSFLVMFGFFNRIFREPKIELKWMAILAALSGFALLTRISNVWLILIILGIFLSFGRIKKALIYSTFLFIAYLPQLIFNLAAFGKIAGYGYYDKNLVPSAPQEWFSLSNFWINFSHFSPRHYFLWFLFSIVALFLVSFFGFKYLKKINIVFSAITLFWFLTYMLFYWLFDIGLSQLRYFLPAIPAFISLFVAAVIYLAGKINQKNSQDYV